MRRPFYRESRSAWYHTAKVNGKLKQVFLSKDRDEAFELWERWYRPREVKPHEPIGQREVIVTKTRTVTKTQTRTVTKPIIQTVVKTIEVPASAPCSTCAAEPKPMANPIPKQDKPKKRKPENVKGRYAQFERLTLITELLTPLRRGGTISEIYNDVCDLLGRVVSPRTVRRDLEFLAQMNVVDTDDGYRYRWVGASVRAVVLERMAEAMGDRHE